MTQPQVPECPQVTTINSPEDLNCAKPLVLRNNDPSPPLFLPPISHHPRIYSLMKKCWEQPPTVMLISSSRRIESERSKHQIIHSNSPRSRRKEGRPLIHPVRADFDARRWGEINARRGKSPPPPSFMPIRRREMAILSSLVTMGDSSHHLHSPPLIPLNFNTMILLYPCSTAFVTHIDSDSLLVFFTCPTNTSPLDHTVLFITRTSERNASGSAEP
jgi:hypothetical protein